MTPSFSFSAPGRAGILGNPSDIYGGFVLSVAIPARNTCTIRPAGESLLPSDTTLWSAATARLPLEGSWVVEWETEVPRSSGLAGSTALLAATVACIQSARGEDSQSFFSANFAELVRDIELREANVVCGYQDAYMVVHGGLRGIDFAGKHPINSGPLGRVTDAQLPGSFLLVTTGVERLSGSVHGPMRDRWLAGEKQVVDAMVELTKMARDAYQGVDEFELAKAMQRNFEIVQGLGGSGESIDQLVQDCLTNGAKAAKLAGAGMGGTVIALCDDPHELRQRLAKIGYNRFLHPQVSAEGREPGIRAEQ
jgi:galactokinase/mevalonate kinase-like predicted kinase